MNDSAPLGDLQAQPTAVLVDLAVRNERSACDTSDREDLGPLVALHERANRDVFSAAAAMAASSDHIERAVCAQILRELGHQDARPFSREAVPVLAAMARVETDPYVLMWVVSALTQRHDEPEALEVVLPFARHPDGRVRHAVAANPFGLVSLPQSADARLIDALIELSADSDADTRWYATVALADEYPGDSAALRAALVNRLSDPDEQVARVAKAGLAKRSDSE